MENRFTIKSYLKRYKMLRGINDILNYSRIFGLRYGIFIFFRLKRKKGTIKLRIHKYKYPILLRACTSDIQTFLQVFFYKEYDIDLRLRPKTIIDGGANIGLASIFFANKFPDSKIIAVEPEISNINMFKINTANYKNVELIESALWHRNAYLKIQDLNLGYWGFTVEETDLKEESSFSSVTIDEILKLSNKDFIDILKLDIEGSEIGLFSFNYESWISKVNVIIIELHEDLKPGCGRALYSATANIDFLESKKGENIVLKKRNLSY